MAVESNVSAVLFDMDGTLIDSEMLTERVIRKFCDERGVGDVDYRWTDFYGVTWHHVARRITADHLPDTDHADVAWRLHEIWESVCADNPPPPVPGARAAVVAAHACMPTAIVSSAFLDSIDRMIERLELQPFVTQRVGAEAYARTKPAPDGFLYAAELLGVAPESCLVFEDSIAGLQSAKAAGMTVIAIAHRGNAAAHAAGLADRTIDNFLDLDDDFFDRISAIDG